MKSFINNSNRFKLQFNQFSTFTPRQRHFKLLLFVPACLLFGSVELASNYESSLWILDYISYQFKTWTLLELPFHHCLRTLHCLHDGTVCLKTPVYFEFTLSDAPSTFNNFCKYRREIFQMSFHFGVSFQYGWWNLFQVMGETSRYLRHAQSCYFDLSTITRLKREKKTCVRQRASLIATQFLANECIERRPTFRHLNVCFEVFSLLSNIWTSFKRMRIYYPITLSNN